MFRPTLRLRPHFPALQVFGTMTIGLFQLHRFHPQFVLLVWVWPDARVPHACRDQHVSPHVGMVARTRRFLDDASEQRVAEVGVRYPAAGRERQLLTEHVPHDVRLLQTVITLLELTSYISYVVVLVDVQLVEHRVVERLHSLVPAALVTQQVFHCNIAQSRVAFSRLVSLQKSAPAEHLQTTNSSV